MSASVGAVGNRGDKAIAETVRGLYKAKLMRAKRLWKSIAAVQLATMGRVRWWKTACPHEGRGYRTHAEVEAAAYSHDQDAAPVTS